MLIVNFMIEYKELTRVFVCTFYIVLYYTTNNKYRTENLQFKNKIKSFCGKNFLPAVL